MSGTHRGPGRDLGPVVHVERRVEPPDGVDDGAQDVRQPVDRGGRPPGPAGPKASEVVRVASSRSPTSAGVPVWRVTATLATGAPDSRRVPGSACSETWRTLNHASGPGRHLEVTGVGEADPHVDEPLAVDVPQAVQLEEGGRRASRARRPTNGWHSPTMPRWWSVRPVRGSGPRVGSRRLTSARYGASDPKRGKLFAGRGCLPLATTAATRWSRALRASWTTSPTMTPRPPAGGRPRRAGRGHSHAGQTAGQAAVAAPIGPDGVVELVEQVGSPGTAGGSPRRGRAPSPAGPADAGRHRVPGRLRHGRPGYRGDPRPGPRRLRRPFGRMSGWTSTPCGPSPRAPRRIHLNNAGAALLSEVTVGVMTAHLRREVEMGGYEAAAAGAAEIAATYAGLAELLGGRADEIAPLRQRHPGLGRRLLGRAAGPRRPDPDRPGRVRQQRPGLPARGPAHRGRGGGGTRRRVRPARRGGARRTSSTTAPG